MTINIEVYSSQSGRSCSANYNPGLVRLKTSVRYSGLKTHNLPFLKKAQKKSCGYLIGFKPGDVLLKRRISLS